jgi:type VI secretion system secreted protein Hcp
MSVQIVLRIGKKGDAAGIDGESIVGKGGSPTHEGEIDVLSWSWGITQTGSAHVGSGGGAGTADVHDLTITKYVDKASPLLAKFCFLGTVIKPNAILTCIKVAGGTDPSKPNKVEFIKITMGGTVMISSFSPGGSGSDERFTETITLHFSEVTYEYTTQGPDNTKGTPGDSGLLQIGT